MPHIDSLLQFAHSLGADEVRVAPDRAPMIFAGGVQKRLTIAQMSPEMLRDLLNGLLNDAHESELAKEGKVAFTHDVKRAGTFRVKVTLRDDQISRDAVFMLAAPDAEHVVIDEPPAEIRNIPTQREMRPATAPPSPPLEVESFSTTEPTNATTNQSPLHALLLRAQSLGASDLHIAAGETPSVRIDGALRLLPDEAPVTIGQMLHGLLTTDMKDRIQAGISVDFAIELPSNSARSSRVRANIYATSKGLAAAFRLLPPNAPALESLAHGGLLSDLPTLANGLVIVCGPTGSGKSTTLAALAQTALRQRSVMLVSLEDPIEYALQTSAQSLVRQRQIGRDVRDFATGLRDALREDPDVILVGEMRDEESISLALTAAETGHLVLTTLHSRSAASAIERIVDVYPEGRQAQIRAQLADSLRAVVAQRLVPRAHSHGRALALEVLRVNTSVAAGLREGKISTVTTAMQSGKRDGMVTLEKSLADLTRTGEVSLDDARAAANDRDAFALYRQAT